MLAAAASPSSSIPFVDNVRVARLEKGVDVRGSVALIFELRFGAVSGDLAALCERFLESQSIATEMEIKELKKGERGRSKTHVLKDARGLVH